MRKNYLQLIVGLVLCVFKPAMAQKGGKSQSYAQEKWKVKDPFEQQVFIENNEGQFNGRVERNEGPVLYGTRISGVEVYFTGNGIVYRYDKYPETTQHDVEESEREHPACISYVLREGWEGAGQARVMAEDKVSFYYCYPQGNKHTTIAHAFKKLLYKNIYPNIDIEYSFKEDKKGIEYRVIVHPGGDLSQVKLLCADAKSMKKNMHGDIEITSDMGLFTDHAVEKAYYEEDGQEVKTEYVLKDKEEGFNAGEYDHSKTLIIDPFKTNPLYTGYNAGYDVCYDVNGNVYAYGSFSWFQEVKIDNTGAIKWIFNAVFPATIGGVQYGDFAVDENSGTSYVTSSGDAIIIKVNTLGKQLDSMDVSSKMNEIWRLAYNHCEGNIVIGGGGTALNYQLALLDTSLTSFNPVNVLGTAGGHHDVNLLAIDNTNNYCYFSTALAVTGPSWGNDMNKVPMGSFSPILWTTPSGFSFTESCCDINYIDGVGGHTLAMNGLVASPNWLYGYDGKNLNRYNKTTGTTVSTKAISTISYNWGGIDVDWCDNLYLGYDTVINIYDSALTVLSTVHPGYQVYDLHIMPNNQMCVAGKGFVSAYNITTNPMTISKTRTNAGCGANSGIASAQLVGCGSDSSKYNYLWSTGATTQQISGLSAGTYTVTISVACDFKFTDTLSIGNSGPGGLNTTASQTNVKCNAGNNGVATDTVSGGTPPYTYTWSNGATTSSITGLSAGSYTCTVTDSKGCTDATVYNITQPPAISVTMAPPTNITCNGDSNGVLNASGSGGTSPYTYSWNTGQTTTGISGLKAGTYTVTVTDAAGCSSTASASITQPAVLSSTINPVTNVLCGGAKTGSATASPNGGSPGYTYAWSNGNTNANATGLSAGSYTVTVTDNNGCSTTANVTITEPTALSVSTSPVNIKCNGTNNGSASATPSGGTPNYTYTWTGGQTNASATGLSAGTYTVTVTDNNGCTSTSSVTITQPQKLADTLKATTQIACAGGNTGSITVGSKGGTGTYTYNWAPGGETSTTVSGLSAGVYTITVKDSNGCVASIVDTLKQPPTPKPIITGKDSVCSGGNVTLTATGGGVYLWSPGGSTNSSITVNPASSSTYSVQVTVGPCSADTTFKLTVLPLPSPTLSGNTKICKGQSTTIGAAGGTSYLWTPGGNTSASINVTPSVTTTYTVQVSNGNCIKDTTITVVVNTPPTVTITPSQMICPGNPVTLTATGGGTYVWSNGATTSSITVSPSSATSYTVVVSNGCKDSASTKISVDASASSLGACCDTTIAPGDSVVIGAYGGSNYIWSPSAGLSCTNCPDPTATPAVTTTYTVTSNDSAGCPVARAVTVFIETPCADFTVPNIFTPNNDGRNDDFVIRILNPSSYSIIIYDRWGKVMYKSNDPTSYWNGTISGTDYLVPDGVYYYILKATCSDNNYVKTGFVTVLR